MARLDLPAVYGNSWGFYGGWGLRFHISTLHFGSLHFKMGEYYLFSFAAAAN